MSAPKIPVLGVALALALILCAPAGAGPLLKMIAIDAGSPLVVKKLAAMGLDIAAVREGERASGARGLESNRLSVEAVVSERDIRNLERLGVAWRELSVQAGARGLSAFSAAATESVYHSFDEPTLGIRDRLHALADDHPALVKLETIGHSYQHRPIIAVRVTADRGRHGRHHGGDDDDDDGDRHRHRHGKHAKPKPQVLFTATTHAREWISTQVAMRLLDHLTGNYGSDDRITDLLDTVEIWVIPVVNPDGYEYTFTNERLWRKNLRDNDGDGQITGVDGVDLNRNYQGHWGYDNEGSTADLASATYRGPAPESEPETQALVRFIKRNKFRFALSYHSYGNLILYPWGWQVKTPSFDDPIFVAQAGTDENPSIVDSLLGTGYDPGVGADLYITNGEFTDWAYGEEDVPAYTVELTLGQDAGGSFYGFEFPDDEAQVQSVFEDNLEFALSLAESAPDPARPVSPVGIETEDVYHQAVASSHGERQIIDVVARRKGFPALLWYSVDGGHWRLARFKTQLGRFYNDQKGLYYDRYRATIKGQAEGSEVTYWISKGFDWSGPYTYTVAAASGNPVLIVSAEDYSGDFPTYAQNTAPNYLTYYTDALDAAGIGYDVWDVSEQAAAPSYADVLSHYKVVLWYTGDDYAPSVPGFEVHEDTTLAVREFMNSSGGRLFATGQDLGWISAVFGLFSDDFLQYYLGAFTDIDAGGADAATGEIFSIVGESGDPVFDGLTFAISGGTGADNQATPSSFLLTSQFLPQFEQHLAARYDRPGGPFSPNSGSFYAYSNMADIAYKRLGGTFTLPAGAPALSFYTSYDIETDWDFAFVEVRPVGSEAWTTLADANGATTTNTGQSCLSGWVDQLHPGLANYMDAACNPTGATGSWNAFTGNSGGWQQVVMDLSAYAGQTVELHIAYATDWSTQNLGMFVDDIQIAGAPLQDFETNGAGWTPSLAPGSFAPNNWERIPGSGFLEGPAVRTEDTVYLGFGFEAIDSFENRAEVMRRVMEYLGL